MTAIIDGGYLGLWMKNEKGAQPVWIAHPLYGNVDVSDNVGTVHIMCGLSVSELTSRIP